MSTTRQSLHIFKRLLDRSSANMECPASLVIMVAMPEVVAKGTPQEIQQKGVKAEKWVKCYLGKSVVLYNEDNKVKKINLEILTASNQKGEKIKVAEK